MRLGVVTTVWWSMCFLCSPALATSVFQSDFSDSIAWQEVFNSQVDAPDQTCRGADGEHHWSVGNGEARLQITQSVPCKAVIVAQEDIPWPEVADISFDMDLTIAEMDRNLLIRWQDANNYLGFHLFGNTVTLEKVIDGNTYAVSPQAVYFHFENFKTYSVRMHYDQTAGVIRLWFDDELIYTGQEHSSDPQLTRGKPALGGSVGAVRTSTVVFRNYSLQDIGEELTLSVPAFRQNNPLWTEIEYDTASRWTSESPTIGRWGCALTSAVMVLRYHGITALPDGRSIDPLTLNTWLHNQPDGYISPGLVNWRALTRLTWWHKEAFGTPALEMHSELLTENAIAWSKNSLQSAVPPIFDHGGHFTVGYAYGPGESQIHLHDPLGEKQTLQDYHNTVHSARVFVPSHTDLRAISLLVQPGTRATFASNDEPLQIEPIPLFALESASSLPLYWLYDLPQPPDSLTFTISTQLPADTPQLLTYARDGSLTSQKTWLQTSHTDFQGSIYATEDTVQADFSLPPLNQSQPVFSPLALHTWLSWGDIRSPLITQFVAEQYAQLHNAPTQTEAEEISNFFMAKLTSWHQLSWITASSYQALTLAWHQSLLDRFP